MIPTSDDCKPGKINYPILVVYSLFFLTGATGLVYQLTWTRDLTLVFGASHQAVSIVLAAFMAGLGLGGYCLGKGTKQMRSPLFVYAVLELLVGGMALVMPYIIQIVQQFYIYSIHTVGDTNAFVTGMRIVLLFGILSIPTFCMGGTLPVLVRYCVRERNELSSRLSMLYGINTLGGVIGVFLGGFYLLPDLGVLGAERVCAVLNILVGIIAFYASRYRQYDFIREPVQPIEIQKNLEHSWIPKQGWDLRLTFWGTAVCGFCALGFEVMWTRGLTIVLGSSVYSLTILLMAFLSGIALGSLVNALPLLKRIHPAHKFAGLVTFAGLVSLWITQHVPMLPDWAIYLTHMFHVDFAGMHLITTMLIGYGMFLLPALLFGMAFPVAGEARSMIISLQGKSVGDCVLVNTWGCVCGALMAGYVLIPVFGLQQGLLWLSVVLLGYGFLLIVIHLNRFKRNFGLAVIFGLVGFWGLSKIPTLLAPWDLHVLATFQNNAKEQYINQGQNAAVKKSSAGISLVFYQEGKSSTVAVNQHGLIRSLLINGKVVASDGREDIGVEKLLGQIPCLLHPDPKNALVIGLGSGITLGAVSAHPDVEKVRLVEIEPAVINAAKAFNHINNQPLQSPKLSVTIQDGRNYLLTTDEKYDVITADPIHPWTAGSTYLFTREYYSIVKSRLTKNGIACQWLPMYELSKENVQSVMATFLSVFPYCTVWQTHFDLILAGSKKPLWIDWKRIQHLMQNPLIAQDLELAGIAGPDALMGLFVTDEMGMKRACKGAVINTDDNLYLEFSSPKNVNKNTIASNLHFINSIRNTPMHLIDLGGMCIWGDELRRQWRFHQAMEEKRLELEYRLESNNTESIQEILARLESMLHGDPESIRIRQLYSEACLLLGKQYGGPKKIGDIYRRSIDVNPKHAKTHNELANLLIQEKKLDEAQEHLEKAVRLSPMYTDAWINLGTLHKIKGDREKAEEIYHHTLSIVPHSSAAHYNLGVLSLNQSRLQKALFHFKQAQLERKDFAEAIFGEASILFTIGEMSQAKRMLERVIHLQPDYGEAYHLLGEYWEYQDHAKKAKHYYEIANSKRK